MPTPRKAASPRTPTTIDTDTDTDNPAPTMGGHGVFESAANIADLPSRCDSKLAARMLQRHFGRAVKPRRMLLPPLRACRGQGF